METEMKKETCTECGKRARATTGKYRFDEVGIPVVIDKIPLVKCGHCGNVDPVIPNLNALIDGIAFSVISRCSHLTGAEVRFLRKYLGLPASEFARLIDVDRTTISKWDNAQQDIGAQSDRLIRLLVASKSKELRKKIERVMENYRELTDSEAPRTQYLRIDPFTMEYQYA
jgi:DNA-binding transcriptional regulator YiaG